MAMRSDRAIVVGAVNQAVAQAKQLHAEAINRDRRRCRVWIKPWEFFGAEDTQGDHPDAQDGPD